MKTSQAILIITTVGHKVAWGRAGGMNSSLYGLFISALKTMPDHTSDFDPIFNQIRRHTVCAKSKTHDSTYPITIDGNYPLRNS